MFCFSVIHRDGDGVPDGYDNCVDLPNGEQADVDDDKIGIPVKEIVHFCHESEVAILFQKANDGNGLLSGRQHLARKL